MSTSDASATWLSLLDEKKQDIKKSFGQGYSAPENISSGKSFRAAFGTLCTRRGEYKLESRFEATLLPSFTAITELARAVGQSTTNLQLLAPNKSLEGLIWCISLAVIERGCRAGAQLGLLVTLIAELNNKVPRFSTNGGDFQLPFPNERRVQKPLQEVYSLFIDSYLFITNFLQEGNAKSNADPTSKEPLEDYIAEMARRFEEARGRYDVMVHQATEDKEREEMHLEQPSLDAQRTLPDHTHVNSKYTREVTARFVSIRNLGRGSYGDVDEVRELSTGASYARKHIHMDTAKSQEELAKEVTNEVACMHKLHHLHIATVLFYMKDEDAYSIFMLPVADCDLSVFLGRCIDREYPSALTKQIYPWFGCLLGALAYAHRLKIKHQDIKPGNILIKKNKIYLSDFGLAKDFAEINTSASHGEHVHGTPVYRAPEVQPGHKRGSKADVFALGCVYSEMFSVVHGRSLQDYRDVRHDAGSTAFRDCLPTVQKWMRSFETNKLSELLMDEILSMVEAIVEERHTAEQAVHFLKREPALFCVE